MSTTQQSATAPTTTGDDAPATSPSRRPIRSGKLLTRATIAVAVVAVGSSVAVRAYSAHASGSPQPTRAISLPSTLAGWTPLTAATDPTRVKRWKDKARVAAAGHALVARGYGSADHTRTLRVVAARTDLTGSLEQAWAADKGHQVGADRCTQNLRLVPSGTAGIRPTVMLCWRTSDTLSAYTVVIAPKSTVQDAEAAGALDQVWAGVAAS